MRKSSLYTVLGALLTIVLFNLTACKKEEANPNTATNPCQANSTTVFEEKDGLIVIESEKLPTAEGWQLESVVTGFTGTSYMQWHGENNFNTTGQGLIAYQIRINTPGTYRIQWHCRINEGNNRTEANDAWLRLANATDFYAIPKNANSPKYYPHGSGKSPNPGGSGKDGWFKVYTTIVGDWTWRTFTNDDVNCNIFADFAAAGDYTVEISGRSKGFAIDRIVFYKDDTVQENTATDATTTTSNVVCQ